MPKAVDYIKQGKCIIYPTETLYAIGGSAFSDDVANEVVQLKNRPASKPLPVIVGSMRQLDMVTGWRSKALERLTSNFWPGPLSILVPAGKSLSPQVRDSRGFTSVRWTVHPIAQRLCLESGVPLIATSANTSGRAGAAKPHELDPALVGRVALSVLDRPWPSGGLPSTVVRCMGTDRLAILRQGAVSRAALLKAGFTIV
ncbi:MAG: L-threonylcarbamoyladenylate synthase [Desulfovibrio sp.]|uniref:L-threonylcarbamoyladenylate synthase n=1 Tax=Desulfovibrio sp. 7SRBS1 TaxID=3378064 RepID=UPI003B3D14C9